MKRLCKNCEFFDSQTDTTGLCRFSPPARNTPVWPTVTKTDWCSQFVQGEEDQRQEALRTARRIIFDGQDRLLAGESLIIPLTHYTWFADEIIAYCESLNFTPRITSTPDGNVAISRSLP